MVSILVNVSKTFVFNREFRPHSDLRSYISSAHSLEEYIANKQQANELRKDLMPGKYIIFHPLSSIPFSVSVNDKRVQGDKNSLYLYLNEVLVHENIIPPQLLAFHPKQINLEENYGIKFNDDFSQKDIFSASLPTNYRAQITSNYFKESEVRNENGLFRFVNKATDQKHKNVLQNDWYTSFAEKIKMNQGLRSKL
ncbi:MAG: hypothetical protein J0H68_04935 [Sphingobacteriia bacterium]|nr:hypothetical protein [Sphingobacteriia bacterium]